MRHLVLVVLLAGCNQWVRSVPSHHYTRNMDEQREDAVFITMDCYPFAGMPALVEGDDDDVSIGETRQGWGVLVSDWQVLTALHVVDCPSTIPSIYVVQGERWWKFAPEKEWRDQDVARIQMRSADSVPDVGAPTVRYSPLVEDEFVYVQGFETVLGESKGRTLYQANTSKGYSGAGIYDSMGYLVGIHLGTYGDYGRMARIEPGMVP